MMKIINGVGATALPLLLSLASIPMHAFAQLDASAPTVTITSPTSGATVSGAIIVKANASDDIAVGGVQFQLDGIGGAEDTTAPYEVTWDTSTASNGSHTI